MSPKPFPQSFQPGRYYNLLLYYLVVYFLILPLIFRIFQKWARDGIVRIVGLFFMTRMERRTWDALDGIIPYSPSDISSTSPYEFVTNEIEKRRTKTETIKSEKEFYSKIIA